MKEITLAIMAAGRGSRFGGLKQIESVDGGGRAIIDYSVYDAIRVGFRRVVFVIRKEIEADFRRTVGERIGKMGVAVDYAFQEIDRLPSGFCPPKERKKPWGTALAVACLKGVVDSPFALINADDYYGREAFRQIFDFLSSSSGAGQAYAMVGYRLKNTLSKNGKVSRGVCATRGGYLGEIRERGGVYRVGDKIFCDGDRGDVPLDPNSVVSVNLWGFTPEIIDECESRFASFLKENLPGNPQSAEFYLPSVISALIGEGVATVRVLDCESSWQGITYREDREELSAFLSALRHRGEYPEDF